MREFLVACLRPAVRRLRKLRFWLSVNRLVLLNRASRHAITSLHGPVVSLTSYGPRVQSVFLTIESIGRGDLLPSRIILWLDDPTAFGSLPESLRRLERRGLEVKLAEQNYGPHTKYFPYLTSEAEIRHPLVTADDDILYPRGWLSGLAGAYALNDQVINCYRAHVLTLGPAGIGPYLDWPSCTSTEPSFRNFATGVSGVIYPPRFLQFVKSKGREFLELCPKADDIWLHVNAIRSGYKIKQVTPTAMHFPFVPHTQEVGLSHANVGQSGNDRYISNVYSSSDIRALLGDG